MKRPDPKIIDNLRRTLRTEDQTEVFSLRVGVIDDPSLARKQNARGELDPPLDPMDYKSETVNIVNTATGLVAVRWIDGGIGGGVLLPSEPIDSLSSALSKAVEIVPQLSMGLWGGKHPGTGQVTVCGFEFMPPVGSVVVVGFIRGKKPVIMGYWLPHHTTLFEKSNSRYPVLTPGEIRISSFGGSYIALTSSVENSKVGIGDQVADVIIQHVGGSSVKITRRADQKYGELSLLHASGSGIVFNDNGGMEFRQAAIEGNESSTPASAFGINEHDGSLNLESVGDITLKAHAYAYINGNGVFIDSSKELSVKANENSSLNFNKSLSLNVNETLVVTTNEKAFVNFKGGFQLDANGNSLIKGGGDLLVRRTGNIDVRTSIGTLTLVGVTAPGIGPSAAGVVTANTLCPIAGLHVGAIGNSVKASTLAPIAPNAPM